MSDKMEEVRGLVESGSFYPVIIPGVGEVSGKITVAEAGNHYGIQNMSDKTVYTFGPQAYLFAVLVKEVAKSVVHIGEEPLLKKVGELAGFEVKPSAPGKADVVFYSGPSPDQATMERLRSHSMGPVFVETTPEVDQSDHIMYEMAIQRAGMISGFLGYPGMGFETGTKGRPALFVARKKD